MFLREARQVRQCGHREQPELFKPVSIEGQLYVISIDLTFSLMTVHKNLKFL